MSTEPEPLGEETADHGDHEAPRQPIDEGGSGPGATRSDGAVAIGESAQRGHVYAVQGGNLSIADITGLLTGLGAATTAVSVVAKAKIDARMEVRKAEIEAETRRLEITEETKREQMKLQSGQLAPEPTAET